MDSGCDKIFFQFRRFRNKKNGKEQRFAIPGGGFK